MILLSFAISAGIYNQMPDKLATHWNEKGEVNGYSNKFMGLFFLPILMVGIFLLIKFIPKLDPLRKNIKSFEKDYDLFILFMILFFLAIHIISILWNLGYQINMNLIITPLFAALFFYIGIFLKKTKRNWFIGIRTPWTISNDKVWEKTHNLGSKLFKLSALISLVGLIFLNYAIFFIIVPVITFSIYIVIYSYFEYKKLKKK